MTCKDALAWAALAISAAFAIQAAPPALAGPAETWTHAHGKAHGSGVLVSYAVPPSTAAGARATVRLRMAGVRAADGASVNVRDMADGRTLLILQLAPGEVREVELSVLARADGVQFLDVITTQAGRTSVISVPVRVGSGKARLASAGKPGIGADGEPVVVMPAATNSSPRR